MRLDPPRLWEGAFTLDLGPVFFIYLYARDTSKAGKNPFSIGVNRIDRGFPTILPQLVAI